MNLLEKTSFERDVRLFMHLLYPLQQERESVMTSQATIPVWRATLSLVKHLFCTLTGSSFHAFDLEKLEKACVLLLSDTQNQNRALEPIHRALQKTNTSVVWIREKQGFKCASFFEQMTIFIIALRNICRHRFLRRPGFHGPAKLYMFLCESQHYRRVIELNRPASVLVSNDHNPSMMALQYAVWQASVPVDYVQHAHVTLNFPEPRYFRYVFTDGEMASRTYSDLLPSDSSTVIYSIGPVRFEQDYLTVQKARMREKKTLVALAFDYDCSIMSELSVKNLAESKVANLNVRFHPRTSRSLKSEVLSTLNSTGVTIKVFEESSPCEFLQDSKLIFCGDSSVILDAALFGCVPICISSQRTDYYGFLRNGLAYHAEFFPRDLTEYVQDISSDIRTNALSKYVSAPFLSGVQPYSSERIVKTIVQGNKKNECTMLDIDEDSRQFFWVRNRVRRKIFCRKSFNRDVIE